jgi:hypothetical protein
MEKTRSKKSRDTVPLTLEKYLHNPRKVGYYFPGLEEALPSYLLLVCFFEVLGLQLLLAKYFQNKIIMFCLEL